MMWTHDIGEAEIVAACLVAALNAYVLTGGADFGGGVWYLLARGSTREQQRAHIADSIAPIWEANHVWLILVIVVLFTAFPTAFADVSVVLHIPLSLMLVGIVLRGSAFVFRSYGRRGSRGVPRWERVFAIASATTPILLGITIGAIASGAVGAISRASPPGSPTASFAALYVAPWASPFPIAVGLMALALFAYLAAIYLALAADDTLLREQFRRRALGAAVAVFITAGAALAESFSTGSGMGVALTSGAWAVPWQLATGGCALAAIGALVTRRYALARAAAALQVSLILWGWAFAQYPSIIPGAVAIREGAAPPATLTLLLWGLAGGTVILAPSLAYLFRTFAATSETQR